MHKRSCLILGGGGGGGGWQKVSPLGNYRGTTTMNLPSTTNSQQPAYPEKEEVICFSIVLIQITDLEIHMLTARAIRSQGDKQTEATQQNIGQDGKYLQPKHRREISYMYANDSPSSGLHKNLILNE